MMASSRRGSVADPVEPHLSPEVARELWCSFVSLLRSYTAAHGLNGTRQAVLEVSDDHLLVRAVERMLSVRFDGQRGSILRESGAASDFTMDEHGRLVFDDQSEEMDMVAERLAREIMR